MFPRTFSAVAVILFSVVSVTAQYKVKGVVDDAAGEAEAFATVRVYAAADSVKPKALGITGEDGAFESELPSPGDYVLKISSVGKQGISEAFSVSASAPVKDFGRMVMADNAAELGEIEVVATRPLVSKEIDRIGYDVQADEDSKTSNIQDILRKVPMVTVDADGTIKVKWSTNFKIYKNGRPNNAFTSNAKDIFAAIPASMIKKIEVITDPGAREDAEGVGAILNIVTMEDTEIGGIMGSVNTMVSTRNPVPGGSVWLMGNIGKLSLSGYGGYFRQDKKSSESRSETDYRFVDTGNRQKSNQESKSWGNIGFWGLEGSYELDSLNLFTVEFNGVAYNIKANAEGRNEMLAPDNSLIYSYNTRYFSPKNSFLDFSGNFNYQRHTRLKGETITLSYQVSNNNNDASSESEYTDCVNFPAPYTGMTTDTKLHFIEQTFQADWTRPLINDHNNISVGAKLILRDNNSKADNYYEGWEDQRTDFKHRTTIGAGYLDYRYSLNRFSARAGLRYEYSRLAAKFKDGSQEDFASNLNDWVPNASVMYNLNDASTLKASFSTRINRPGITYLNPAITLSPSSQSYGNPNLESIHYRSFGLNYSLIKQKFNVDLSAGYSFADNTIASYTTVDDNDFTTTTYGNVGKMRQFDMSIFVQWNISQKTNVMINGDINHKKLSIPSARNSRWGYNFYMRASQTLPWNLRLQGFMFFEDGSLSNVYSYSDNSIKALYHGFSLQKSFLKEDRLTIRLQAQCPFSFKGITNRTVTDRGVYTGESWNSQKGRQYGVSVSFRFGSVKAQVRKIDKSISNDDIEGGNKAAVSTSGGGM